MKKQLLIAGCAALCSMTPLHAQEFEKRFEASYMAEGTYEPLGSGATDVGFAADWDDTVSGAITLPFEFTYQNVLIEDVEIETYGGLHLNGAVNEDMELGHILGLNMDYRSAGRGKVLYQTTGDEGNRIFKVEFSNVGRFNDEEGNDTLNFQIWLYEADHAIEYRAGYCNIPADEFATNIMEVFGMKEPLLCGLACNMGDELATATADLYFHAAVRRDEAFSDTAVAVALLAVEVPSADVVNALLHGSYPPSGSVIRYEPKDAPVSLPEVDMNMASVFPNPSADGIFTVQLKEAPQSGATIAVFDMSGRMVRSIAMTGLVTKIDLSGFASGNYFGKIAYGNRQGLFKVTKR